MDPDRWLDNENPRSRLPEDARHWIQVYTELLAFKDKALATAHHSLGGMSEEEARVEMAQTDLAVMEAERDRLRRHLDFWKQRHLDLTTPTTT